MPCRCSQKTHTPEKARYRHAIPEANPGLYLGLSLAVTFVFNILIGIPLYTGVVQRVWG